jgi:glutathione S-transferase
MMDWLNSNFYKDFGYGVVYPQLFPHHKRPDDDVQAATLDWGKQKSRSWLKILDEKLIGPNRRYLCGDRITLADYMGAEMISLGGVIGCNYASYPNVERWLGNMKALPCWAQVHQAIDGFAGSLKDRSFVAI